MNTEEIREAARLIKQGMSILDSGPLDCYLHRLAKCYDFLLTFAPYQPGERVRLIKTPVITERECCGWIGAKHFLKAGAVATVRRVWSDGVCFSYGLEFDDDSWLSSHDRVVHPYPPEERHPYCFEPSYFERLPTTSAGEKHVQD